MSNDSQDSPPEHGPGSYNAALEPCTNPMHFRRTYGTNPPGEPSQALGTQHVEVRCSTWHCPPCAERRKIEVRKHLTAGLALGISNRDRIRMVTFTVDPATWPHAAAMSADSIRDFNRRVSRVIHDYRRIYKLAAKRTPYARVNEPQTNQRPHAHLIWRGAAKSPPIKACTNRDGSHSQWCSERRPCIKRLAVRHGLGPVVDVRAKLYGKPITSETAARYLVGKYLSKSIAAPIWPRHSRRYTYSPTWADTLTLGKIRANYNAQVQRRLMLAGKIQPEPPGLVTLQWEMIRPEHRAHYRPPPRAPGELVASPITGEIQTPAPF